MRRAVAICLLVTGCASVQPRVHSDEFAPVGKAEACLEAAPCVKSSGVWMPGDLAAQAAGWGEGLVACKAQLSTCNTVAVEPWVYVLVGVAGALVGGATVAGAFEIRDWLRR